MDPVTHALASFAFARAIYPRAGWRFTGCVIVAGTIADLDRLSELAGPAAFFKAHRTVTHSVLGLVITAAVVSCVFLFLLLRKHSDQFSLNATFLAALLASVLHVVIDVCQSEGVALLWPFSDKRFAADWIDGIDPWILAILLAGVLLPALFGLITEEIGARSKKPRGRTAAWLALAAVATYLGGRIVLHANAVNTLEARTYRGEPARRVAALPEAASLFTWHGIVETESALHEVSVHVGPGASFDPETSLALYKPQPSAFLDAGRGTSISQKFLRATRFPKASVEKTEDSYRFELRDLQDTVSEKGRDAVAVIVEMESTAKVRSQRFIWERELGNR